MNSDNKKIYIFIFCISLAGTLLSLYYSYYGDIIKNSIDGVLFDSSRAIKPCDLCWYIRLAQYPTTLISGIALFSKEYLASKKHILGLSIFGILISGYKVALEYGLINLQSTGVCGAGSVPCDIATNFYGTNISLAAAGLLSFVLICILLSRTK